MLLTFFCAWCAGLPWWLAVLACCGVYFGQLRLDCKSRQVVYFLQTDLGLLERVRVV